MNMPCGDTEVDKICLDRHQIDGLSPSVLTIDNKEVILPSSRTWNEALSDKEGTDAVSE
jgi:hypothetical protein